MVSKRRVVITGMGVLSPIGQDLAAYWQALCAGQSGVRPLESVDTSLLPFSFAGQVVGFDARKILPKSQLRGLKVMARTVQLGVCAAELALAHARVDSSTLDPERFGVTYGSGMIATELDDIAYAAEASVNCQPGAVSLRSWGEKGIPAIQPLWMLKYLPNMPACHVSIMHNAQGPNNSITESDVASLLALGESYNILRRDGADFFLVGGAESKLNPLSLSRLALFMHGSRRNAEPARACRPFDRQRDGAVVGEGAAVVALEELSHAQRRGATIYAEMVGYGAAFDRRRDGSGLARAIRTALRQADITPDQIGHINAHGLSTPQADIWESRAITEVFGQPTPPVFAPKGHFGNVGAGGSVLELIASLLALHHQQLPATLNYEYPDPQCPVRVAAGSPQPLTSPYMLKIAFTDIGQCGAVVLRRWE